MKRSTEIRQDFLDFFASKEHKIVPSASVVPYDDPTLLFTNAGMNQFKDVFLGTGKRDYKRCADTQKCIRVSGKHNDLDEVGHDGYHHTFFEMLGNWSFGDYYKKEAIKWAWELLTGVWKLDKKRLWATVYKDDEEALEYWKTETDIDHLHILKFDEKDNFWEMGDTGPCGPCSEIHYDFTETGCKASDVNAGNPDVMEIWNLVFIQYNSVIDEIGQEVLLKWDITPANERYQLKYNSRDEIIGKFREYVTLGSKFVDTGMGFERIVRVIQNKSSNYLTDVFSPLINEIISLTGREYTGKYEVPFNVIADHLRMVAFASCDGAPPGPDGGGNVTRNVVRRAAFYGRKLDMHVPFIYKLVDVLVETMGPVYPELIESRDYIKEAIRVDEESFNRTIDRGIVFFNDEIERMKSHGLKEFDGRTAFKLHDTYGFPIDLTVLMARELGYSVAIDVYMDEMTLQIERSRGNRSITAYSQTGEMSIEGFSPNILISDSFRTKATNYNPYEISEVGIKTRIRSIHETMDAKHSLCVLDDNPFYAESGGQVSDTGNIILYGKSSEDCFEVIDSKRDYVVINGTYDEPFLLEKAIAKVDYNRRQAIQRNHTATHLLHESLRRVLGSHVKQMGSYLDDKVLRFDFPHFHKLKDHEINKIENIVNRKIKEDIDVVTRNMKIDDAKKEYTNLRMFFGDKYGDEVRVVIIDSEFSVELCGGTHVKNTKDIGYFHITKEESISTGTRRIFAVTGERVKNELMTIYDKDEGKLKSMESNLGSIRLTSPEIEEKYRLGIVSLNEEIQKLRNRIAHISFDNSRAISSVITSTADTTGRVEEFTVTFSDEKRKSEKELSRQKVQEAAEKLDELLSKSVDVKGIRLVAGEVSISNADELKEIGDKLREKLKSGVGLLYSVLDDKVSLVATVSDDLIKEKKLSAGKIAGDTAKILGGGGGGKQHLATAGGKDVSKINEAIKSLPAIIEKYLN